MPVHVGANSLKKPHHIVILRFSEVVKDHAICTVFPSLRPAALIFFYFGFAGFITEPGLIHG